MNNLIWFFILLIITLLALLADFILLDGAVTIGIMVFIGFCNYCKKLFVYISNFCLAND